MTTSQRVAKRPLVSPLRYPGGKAALYPRLREIIRANGLAGCTYVEPYAGGAGAATALLVTGQVSKVVINDLDPAVYAFWELLKHDPDYLNRQIKSIALDVEEWRNQKAIYAEADSSAYRELGFATFYLNRTNRSGVLNGGPIGGLEQTGNYTIDARFNRDALIERVRILSLYSDHITVMNSDGLDVIRCHAGAENTFVYADPPYFEKAGSLYMNSFKADDHAQLASALNERSNTPWMLTYDNAPQVKELYLDRRRREFSLRYSAHRVVEATEVMVLSDALVDVINGWPTSPS